MKRRFFLRPIVLTFFYQGTLLGSIYFFYFTFLHLFEVHNPLAQVVIGGLLLLLGFGMTCAWLLIIKRYEPWRIRFFNAVVVLLGTGYFLVLASIIYWGVETLSLWLYADWPTLIIGRLLLSAGILVSIFGIWHSYQIKVRHYKIKINDLPDFWKGRKIAMFADAHLGNFRDAKFIKSVIELVNKQQPDLVLIPGDYFDGTPADLEALAEPLTKLVPSQGVFFCDGNHEEFHHNVPFVHALKKAGVNVLANEFVEIHGLQIIGVEYRASMGNHKLRKILKQLNYDRTKPSILMRHVPSALKSAKLEGVSLMVSGHTHLGQVFPFNFLTKIIFKGFDYGLRAYKKMQVLTTSGVGTWGPPQRVGTSSEIVVITLH